VPASDAGTVGPDQPSLPGTLAHGADARTWVRSFPGITMVNPNVVRGPHESFGAIIPDAPGTFIQSIWEPRRE
jgi:hypothetical protein